MQTGRPRHVALECTPNLRDLGGYPTLDGRRTRWGMLFRSANWRALDEAAHCWLAESGLRTVIDLRDDDEVAQHPSVFREVAGVSYRRVPLYDTALSPGVVPDLSRGYRKEFDERGERLVRVLEVLAEPDALPAVFHCAAGKDRTGVVAALILATLRVPAEVIVRDYAVSLDYLGPTYLESGQKWVRERGDDWEAWRSLFTTPPERMAMTLAYIDERYGGAEAYLLSRGLGIQTLERLRAALTEPVGHGAASP